MYTTKHYITRPTGDMYYMPLRKTVMTDTKYISLFAWSQICFSHLANTYGHYQANDHRSWYDSTNRSWIRSVS